jgi:hypothetical protein
MVEELAEATAKERRSKQIQGAAPVTVDELITALGSEISFESKYDQENEEWVLDVHLEGGRNQEMRLFAFEEGGRQMVRFLTGIGSASEFSSGRMRSALELNASLLYGALAIFEGNIVLTASAPLNRPDATEATDAIRYMTRMADAYEKILFGLDRA